MRFVAGTCFGRYEIRSLLGAGGMGEVYRAEDRVLLRPVAIKFIQRHEGVSESAQKRFLREARTASQINHPNIVTIHEISETDDHTYIVMEYVEGRTLRSMIRERALSAEAALEAAAQIADALQEAHAGGVLHRDIKPENIIVNARGQAKLLDFGLAVALAARYEGEAALTARFSENLTDSGSVVGTLPYMSPEQLRKEHPLDARSDIFSFGLVLFEMLTGRHPLTYANAFEAGAAILSAAPIEVGALERDFPPGLARLVARLVTKGREGRPSSFAEVVHELAAVRRQLGAGGPAPGSFDATLPYELAGGATARGREPSPPPQATPTVLVLPLEAVDAQEETAFIGVGMAAVITTGLARVGGLSVLSKSAGAAHAGRAQRDAGGLARELGASLMLEGEVMRAAQKIRVMTRLIDVGSGRVIWGGQYQGDDADLFSIQDKVCESVAAALRGSLSGNAAPPSPRAAAPANMDAFLLYSKGRAFLERREVSTSLDFAIQMFEEAVKLAPDFALAHAGLGEAFWQKYKATRERALVRRALAASDYALVLDPRLPEVHVSLGIVYHGTGKLAAAVEEFNRAVELQPLSDEGYKWLSRCHMELGEPERAIGYVKRAIELRPGYWDNQNQLGICYYTLGRYAEAAEQFRRVINIQPDNHLGYNNLGGMYSLLGQYAEAVAMHRRAIEIHPAAISYNNLGSNYFFLGRFEEAINAYREAIRLNPNGDLLYRNLGDTLLRVGREDEARSQYGVAAEKLSELLAVKPNDAEVLGRLAVCRAKLGLADEALEGIKRATEIEPQSATLMYQRAVVHALTGRAAEAVGHLAAALAHGYSRPEAERDPDLNSLRDRADYKPLFADRDETGAPRTSAP